MEIKEAFFEFFEAGKEFSTDGISFLREGVKLGCGNQVLNLPSLVSSLAENRVPFSWRGGWITLHKKEVVSLGSDKSGFHGHKGRPGRKGGSAPRGVGVAGMGTGIPADVTNFDAGHTKKDFAGQRHIDGDTESQSAIEASRGEVKADLISKLSEESGLSEEDVNELISQWAQTSNDGSYASLHMQEMAAREFGGKLSDWQQSKVDGFKKENVPERAVVQKELLAVQKRMDDLRTGSWGDRKAKEEAFRIQDEEYEPLKDKLVGLGGVLVKRQIPIMSDSDTQKALRTMYNNTQQTLKSEGIETVRMYRGTDLPRADDYQEYKPNTDTLISQNTMSSWSSNYDEAGNFGPLVVAMDVPIDRILSTARTGFGCLTEGEFVILGKPGDQVRVVKNSNYKENQ